MRGKAYLLTISAILGITTIYFKSIVSIIVVICWIIYLRLNKFLFLPILTLILFSMYFYYVDETNLSTLSGSEQVLYGEILSNPTVKQGSVTFSFEIRNKNENVLVSIPDNVEDANQIAIGYKCKLKGVLEKPLSAKNFYDFNYAQYLYYQRVHWLMNAEEITCKTSKLSLIEKLQKYREYGIKKVQKYFPKEIQGYTNALMFGSRSLLHKDDYALYQSHGLSHLLAISGLHVGTILSFIYFILIRFGITKESAMTAMLILLPLYCVVSGAAPSVIRASSMAFLFLAFLRFKKRINAVDAISYSCMFILAIDPYKLFHLGFQLSFIVSFILVNSVVIISRYHSRTLQLLIVTFIAQVASFPLVLWANYEISLLSLPLNLLFIPIYSIIILPLTFIAFFTIDISVLFTIITGLLQIIYSKLLLILHVVEQFPFLMIVFGKPSLQLVFAYYGTIIVGFYLWELNVGWKAFLQAFSLFFIVSMFHWFAPYFDASTKVTFLDVGQGDSIVIKLPYHREVIVIDTGRKIITKKGDVKFNAGQAVVLPFLKANGLKHIDKLIITHGDLDHIGGASYIINRYPVKDLFLPYDDDQSTNVSNLIKQAQISDVTVTPAVLGQQWKVNDNVFTVVHPAQKKYHDKNNQSIVIHAVIGKKAWLFTGDIEKEAEEEVLDVLGKVNIDILKVAHHGSETSTKSQFLDSISPSIAVISAGRNNWYGHPHREVIKRLKERNIVIARTDQLGAISFIYKDGAWQIHSSIKRKEGE
jgi:competence protein ComEC